MLVNARRTRLALIATVFVVSFVILLSARNHEALSAHGRHGLSWLHGAYHAPAESEAGSTKWPRVKIPTTYDDGREVKVYEDAHKFEDADDFFPHFAGIAATEGMTYKEARAGCTWKKDEHVNFMFGDKERWVLKPVTKIELDGRRRQWRNQMMNKLIPWSKVKDRFEGRGIVIVGGNHNTLERVKVLLRALVTLGSSLPVELHYWKDEISEDNKTKLGWAYQDAGGIYFNDLSGPQNIAKGIKGGFGLPSFGFKTAALINSRFAEPMLLDADNIPVIQPEELFESKTYQEFHTLFYPDLARTRPENPMWALTNTKCKMDEWEQESGQLMVDKRRFWYHLQMASWMNNEQGGYYNEMLLGDKDMFRFAWHMLQTKYGRPARWLASAGTFNKWTEKKDGKTEDKGVYCGYSFAQHYPDEGTDQVAFMHGGLLKTVHPELLLWNKQQGGIFRHYKRSPHDTDWAFNPNVYLRWDSADYFHNRSEHFGVPSCTEFQDIEPKPMDELIEGWETFFDQVGGYWLIYRPDLKPPY